MKDFIKKEKIKSCWVNGHVKKSKYPPGKFLLFHHVKTVNEPFTQFMQIHVMYVLIETQERFEIQLFNKNIDGELWKN